MSRGSFGPAPCQQWLGTFRDLLLPPGYTIWSLKVKSESEVAQSCPTLCNPMDCSLQAYPSMGFSRQEYLEEWVAISFSRGSSQPRG